MSSSEFTFRPSLVNVSISTEDGASELLLLNSAYNMVGQGVGSLEVAVPPGEYHLRQRIGDTENLERIEVGYQEGPTSLELKRL